MTSRRAGPEVERLEQLWAGDFGRNYIERNSQAGVTRREFWSQLLEKHPAERILEVGCNTGANLRWLAELVPPKAVFGLDVSEDAIRELRSLVPAINAVTGLARELPFRDDWFDLSFTTGVLIHQPEESLLDVMSEIVRVSRRYVLCGEYYAPDVVEIDYRGETGALFKRDYERLYLESFPVLGLVEKGFLGRDMGWDDVTWWLFEKQ